MEPGTARPARGPLPEQEGAGLCAVSQCLHFGAESTTVSPPPRSPPRSGPTTPNPAELCPHAQPAPADDSSCVPGGAGFTQILDVSIALRSLSPQSGSFNFLLSESHGE